MKRIIAWTILSIFCGGAFLSMLSGEAAIIYGACHGVESAREVLTTEGIAVGALVAVGAILWAWMEVS